MILWHWTDKNNLESILREGLKPNKIGIVYLTPKPQHIRQWWNNSAILLEIETAEIRLTVFDECQEWEVLCWGHISPSNIKLVSSIK